MAEFRINFQIHLHWLPAVALNGYATYRLAYWFFTIPPQAEMQDFLLYFTATLCALAAASTLFSLTRLVRKGANHDSE